MVFEHERYAFIAEWSDPKTDIVWRYQLLFFPERKQIEMHDLKNRRVFLKRTVFPELLPESFCVGNCVNILSRQLRIVDYADQLTSNRFADAYEKTCLMIKANNLQSVGHILQDIASQGLCFSGAKLVDLSDEVIKQLAEVDTISVSREWLSESRLAVIEIIGKRAVERIYSLCESEAREEHGTCNNESAVGAMRAPEDKETAQRVVDIVKQVPSSKIDPNCRSLLALLKPHTLRDGVGGKIVEAVADKFHIHDIRTVLLDSLDASEFCEVYREVLSSGELSDSLQELTSGRCIALHLSEKTERSGSHVEALREFCGPADPEVARCVMPTTLRARFGLDKAKNAIHCTDLEEDRELELQFMFCKQRLKATPA